MGIRAEEDVDGTRAVEQVVERRNRWSEALKSGKYLQDVAFLRQRVYTEENVAEDRYCCLGVACEIYMKEVEGSGCKWGRLNTLTDHSRWMPFVNPQGREESQMMPPEVADYFGVSGGEADELVGLNDDQFISFDEIAEAINTHTREWYT